MDSGRGQREEAWPIPGYTLMRRLGAGASGAVFLARRDRDRGLAAVKFFCVESVWLERVLAALRMIRGVRHPGIPVIEALIEAPEGWAAVMEYLPGCSHSRITRLADLLPAARKTAEVLQHVWCERGWLHRDIKPDNIRFLPEGRVVLPDWHLAAPPDRERDAGFLIGTPAYLAPEAFAAAELDDRSDQYSLGITMFRWWCGHVPFRARTLERLAEAHLLWELPALPGMPEAAARVIRRMTAKHPDERYNDWIDVLDALDEVRQDG